MRIKPIEQEGEGKGSVTDTLIERFLSKSTEEDDNNKNSRRATIVVRHWAKPFVCHLIFFFFLTITLVISRIIPVSHIGRLTV